MDFEASSKVHDQANDEEDDTAPIIDLLGLLERFLGFVVGPCVTFVTKIERENLIQNDISQ